jgi:pimeloyl-ACP methyl ester carboxylesterase
MLFDPQIVRAFRNPWHYSVNLWKYWTGIEVPILALRGVESDMLPANLAHEMVRRNPRTRVHDIEGCGHAPPLMSLDQIQPIADFLTAQRIES